MLHIVFTRIAPAILLSSASFGIGAPIVAGAQAPPTTAARPIEVRDAIEMVRIEDDYGFNERFVTFSPDGSKFAVVVSRGDLTRDVIEYSLIVFDSADVRGAARRTPRAILSIPFHGDSSDQHATPITELVFLGDNRTISFLGTLRGEPRQVYAIDITTREVRALTDHPTAVKAYAVSDSGRLTFFAAAAADPSDSARVDQIRRDGVSAYDAGLLPTVEPLLSALHIVLGTSQRQVRQYFIPSTDPAGPPRLIFDSRRSRRTAASRWDVARDTATQAMPRGDLGSESELASVGQYSADPSGRYALMWPYILGEHSIDTLLHEAWNGTNLYGRSLAAYYGLIDLADGSIEPLLDQLYVPFLSSGNQQLWAPDGASVIIKSLVPLGAPGSAGREDRRTEPPTWLEVQVPSREFVRVPVPAGWSPLRWDRGSGDLILRKADSLVAMRKVDGTWRSPRPLGVITGFNRLRPVVTDGRIVVGVADSLDVPPELAAHDLRTGRTVILTDLNPQLRSRRYGVMERIRFSTPFDSASSALLVKPVSFQAGTRYPLVVLHANHRERPGDQSFLIDGRLNLSGHAAQPLAAHGFMVLFIGTPPSSRPETPSETPAMRANVEGAVRALIEKGYVDSLRVGVSGWSRSAYYTENLLMHSSIPFAAASQLDGGSREYADRTRPYTDEELGRIRTPMLIQAHGQLSLIYSGGFADRLRAQGVTVELLHFANAPHSTRQPRHRLRSLTTHVDWWRYWLQDYEDPDPAKSAQYRRWRP